MRLRRPRLVLSLLIVLAVMVPLLALPATASAARRPLGGGKVVVEIDPFFAQLISAGHPFFPIAPASMSFTGTIPRLVFPVSGGWWNRATSRGTFLLRGGTAYVHYTSPTAFAAFLLPGWQAGINTAAGWTALVHGSRARILDENLMGSHPSYLLIGGHLYVRVNTVILFYSAAFTAAFNAVYGPVLPPGEPFGVATLQAQLK